MLAEPELILRRGGLAGLMTVGLRSLRLPHAPGRRAGDQIQCLGKSHILAAWVKAR